MGYDRFNCRTLEGVRSKSRCFQFLWTIAVANCLFIFTLSDLSRMSQVADQDPSLIDGLLVIKGLSAHHPPQTHGGYGRFPRSKWVVGKKLTGF